MNLQLRHQRYLLLFNMERCGAWGCCCCCCCCSSILSMPEKEFEPYIWTKIFVYLVAFRLLGLKFKFKFVSSIRVKGWYFAKLEHEHTRWNIELLVTAQSYVSTWKYVLCDDDDDLKTTNKLKKNRKSQRERKEGNFRIYIINLFCEYTCYIICTVVMLILFFLFFFSI